MSRPLLVRRFVQCLLAGFAALAGWGSGAARAAESGRVTAVGVHRVTGLPDAVALVFEHEGGLSAERLRVYFDTVPRAGEPATGGDFMLEGPSLYAYPAGASGWAWERIGAPVVRTEPGKIVCVVSAPAFGKKFSWFAEVTTDDWQVGQRWPASGVASADPAKLAPMAAPAGEAREVAVDMTELLAARARSLSAALNGGPDLSAWTPVRASGDFSSATGRLGALGLPTAARLEARLRDAAGGESAALRPTKAWRRGDDLAWGGEALGVAWVLVADSPRPGELRLTGWLRAEAERVLRVEAGLALPLEGKTWWDDMETRRVIDGSEPVFGNFASGRYGLDARQSFYPIGVVEDGAKALVIETDPAEPRVFALGAGRAYLRADYDMALSPGTKKFPGQATFRCSFYAVDRGAEDGFRAALAEFFRRHPDYATRRAPHSGLWMPFSDISKLPGAEDFGFSFFEKTGELGSDVDYAKKNGVLTLVYTEPWLYWLPFSDGEERTPARAEEKMRQIAALGSGWSRDLALSGLAGAARGADGKILMKFMDLPWNKGARMEVSSDPDLAPAAPGGLNRAAAEWKRIAAWLEDPRVDGIYLDSMDAIVQPDHAAAALHAADHPATFTRAGRVPVMAPNVPQYEFTAALGAALRARGKFLMANFPLVDSPFLNRWIDIPGEETDWWSGGQYNPNSRARLDYRRALSGQKPFGFLQSTDFATFEGEPLRRYFETCLLYGFQPSFFSHNAADNPYWHDAKLLERDRHLFRTFVPLTRRIADAGWRPEREARLADRTGLRLEQFGSAADGLWHLAVQNLTEARRDTALVLPAGLGRVAWIEPLTGRGGWAEGGEQIPVSAEPHGVVLFDLVAEGSLEKERAFLSSWRSGGEEAAAAVRTLDSLRAEVAAGLRATLAPVGPVIAGDASTWLLTVRNESARGFDVVDGSASGVSRVSVPAGGVGELRLELPPTEEETRTIGWGVVRADGARAEFARAIRARGVPAIEATGPGSRLLVREGDAEVPLRLRNHTARARECVVEWEAAGSTGARPQSRRVTLAAGADETVRLPVARPAKGPGAVALEIRVAHGGNVRWTGETRIVFLTTRSSLAARDGVRATADSTFGGYSTKALHDGVADGANLAWNEAAWASEDSPAEHWVRFEFPEPVPVEEVVIHWNREGGVTYTGREGLVLGEVATGQELPLANWKSAPGERSTRVTFSRQPLRALRVVQNPGRGAPERPGIMWLSEVEVN